MGEPDRRKAPAPLSAPPIPTRPPARSHRKVGPSVGIGGEGDVGGGPCADPGGEGSLAVAGPLQRRRKCPITTVLFSSRLWARQSLRVVYLECHFPHDAHAYIVVCAE